MWKEWLLWVCFYTEVKLRILNSWYIKTIGVRRGVKTGANPGERLRRSTHPKTNELTLFTMIVYNSENSICTTRPFCHRLFCHSSVVRYRLLYLSHSIVNPQWELNTKYYWNRPLTLLAGSALGSKRAFAPPWKLKLITKIFWKIWRQQLSSD